MQTKQTLERIYHELSAGRISRQDAFAQIKALKRQPLTVAATETLTAVPVWRASTADSPGGTAWTARHIMVLELPGVSPEPLEDLLAGSRCVVLGRPAEGNLAQRYTEYALACFERIKAVLAARPAGAVLLQVVVGEDPEHAVFAGLAALLKTARLENPNFCGQVILSRRDITTAALAQQLEQAQTHASETVIRYERGTQPLALHWQEQAEVQAEPVFKEHGVYLITGGLGGLGVVFAQAILGQTRHARVILTGRQALAGEKQQRFDALQAQADGRVHYRALDLGDQGQVEGLMAELVREHGGLHGIVHGAGMIADNFILKKTAAEFRQVLAPKVMGTLHLDLATAALDLDFFALFSSIASAFGNAGQADYAAANGFLDEFAQLRNTRVSAGERRGRTLAIHWPLWQEGGMRLDAALLAEVERTSGMRPLSTAAGLQAFHRTVAQGRARNLVLEGDLAALQRTVHGTAATPLPLRAPCASETLPRQELLDKAGDYLRRQFSALLKLSPQRIDVQAPLEQYGIDSILAMRLTTQLEQHFGVLSKTLLFEYRSIAELAGFLVESYTVELQVLLAPARGSATAAVASADSAADERAPNRSRLPTPPRRAAEPSAAALMAEPIAIIGLSGRYPESPDIAAYWNNLRDGKDCIVEVPAERWDWREYFSEDRTEGGRHYSRWGGFIEGVAEFDPQFFNIAPREARQIDPQERLFLQHAWLAIEDAGYTRAALQGRGAESATAATELAGQVGVYVGMMYSEYQLFAAEASQRGQRMGLTGSFASIANRVSYAFDLHGPSMTLDTMCSSSLTAIHLACQDLRLGRTRLAIAGGVNVTIHPNKYLALSAGQFISGDGHCQSFGEGGDGYIPGEGVGAVVLKRLSEARRDGDHIYGVIRASALNHGGKTNGYTVPNPQAQAGAIAQALAEAKIDPRHISYIEAHGTGTKLGDPIEIAALARAFGKHTQDKQFCLIGSAKSNIGHCESAAGIAGLTKVLLQMRHRQIVPSLHSARLNPHIDFASTPFTVNQSLTEWEAPLVQGRRLPRIAGISSFGAGGSNAHMIVEEYTDAPASPVLALREPVIVVLSARTAEQLQRKALDLIAFIAAAAAPPDLAAMAYTLQVGREAMEERLGLVVSSIEQLVDTLEGWLAGEDSGDVQLGQVKRHKDALALFSTDADLQHAVDRWLTGRKFEKIVELWVKGLDVRWAKLYGATVPQRVSLPGYPFARERYWLDIKPGTPALAAAGAAARSEVLHPLLQANTSDLYQQGYRSSFRGDEAFCTAQRTLCGAAYLEMARAALAYAGLWQGAVELRNTLWAPPVRVEPGVPVCVEVQAGDADRLDYAIYSVSGDEEIVHCQGQARVLGEFAPECVDIAAVQQRSAQGGSGELLVKLDLAPGQQADATRYVLHPQLLDQALQAAGALLPAATAGTSWLPATLDTLRVVNACAPRMWAWIRHAADSNGAAAKLDIELCDEHGGVCAQLRGLVQEPATVPLQHAAVGAAVADWTDRDGIAITAEGSGIYALRLNAEAVALTPVQASSLRSVVESLRELASLRVLLLAGHAGAVLQGGTDAYNTLLQSGLLQAIAEFPYPVIAALPGGATGAGWWLAACCDLLVCSDSARYGLADMALYAEPAQQAFLAARFAPLQARQLQSDATCSGAHLQAQGWTMPVLPSSEVENHALLLAARLASKPGEALRLLKAHLARELQPLAAALTPIRVAAGSAYSNGEARIIDIDRAEPAAVLTQLSQALQAIAAGNVFCGIVLASTSSAFVACAAADDVLALQAAIAAAPVPVIASLAGDAQGSGWWLGLQCDACVLSETGRYDAAAVCTEAALAARAALDFPQYFGDVLGREVLLSGDAYSGLALKQRAGALAVVPASQVAALALQRARGFAAQSAADFARWKRSRAAAAQRAVAALPAWPSVDAAAHVAEAGIVALAGSVVSATAQADGVLLVELHDRDAKNMFSEALVAAVGEVFAHIAQTPYKAVVLTGYDSYFASGGTKESLLAIQAGTAKFTDLQLFQLALQCDIPVIAAMQGHAIGAGWSLGLFADVVLFGEESHYVSPYMGYGFTPGAGATLSVPLQLGLDLARESLFSAHEYTGRELAQRGVAQAVLPRATVVAAALELAGRIARQPRRVLAGLKQQWAAPLRAAIAPLLQRELAMHEATFVGRADTRALIEGRFLAAAATAAPVAVAQAGVPDPDTLTAVADTLRRLLAQELQLAAGDIDDDAQFIDLGLDSIVGVTWVRKINERYGLDIEATKVYSHPTLAQLSRHVRDEADKRGLLTTRPLLAAAVPGVAPIAVPAATTRQQGRRSRNAGPRGLRALAAPAANAVSANATQPIAIVGMAGQFPQATTLAQFWRNIADGRDCISEVPPRRWDMDQHYRAGAATPGRTNSRWMGLLDDYDLFDPLFFNISPKEAEYMDPQQRLFLQTCWQAIEDAGYNTRSLSGTRCGVFAGCANGDYQQLAPEQRLTAQGFTGNASSILAARISYFFNLQGPCVAIDTACSSSLVAIAQACDSLLSGVSEIALAGGVYVASGPDMHIKTAQAGMLSTDGRCFTFDQRANGFVPGEGVGVVVLKRLSDAVRDNDPIYGTIQGWGVNQDGKTNGITAPNPQSQTRLQQDVYDRFGIDPGSIQLIEAHGTGTKLGDPIEVEALKASFGKYTQKTAYCALGSVKSNIGHCLTAAGIAGFIKLMLSLKHRQQPPTIQFDTLNEHIDLAQSPFFVNRELRSWDVPASERRQAAISSFGFSGTNAHIVVAEHVAAPSVVTATEPAIIVLSARTAEQLQQKVRDLLAFIATAETAPDLAALAYTLQVGREAMDERLGLVVVSLAELVKKLAAYLAGETGIADLQLGQAKRHRETLALFSTDPELQQTVDRWLTSRRYGKVVELWVKGFDWDWHKLHATPPRRISLPTYPFARERYWVAAAALPAGVTTAALHPLLHANTSDLYQQSYRSQFSGDEPFCSEKSLPAMACLEMARAALSLALRSDAAAAIELRDIAWTSTAPIGIADPLHIALDALAADNVAFEIYAADGDAEIVHCHGIGAALVQAAPAALALAPLVARLPRDTDERSHRSRDELLLRLELPAGLRDSGDGVVVHPQLLALVYAAALRLLGGDAAPVALDRLRVFGALPAVGWAWLRRVPQRAVEAGQLALDIELCDEHGQIAAQLHGLVLERVAAQEVLAPAEAKVAEAAMAAAAIPTMIAATTAVASAAPARMAPLRIALAMAAAGAAGAESSAGPAPLATPERNKPRGIALVNPRAVVAAELLRHQVAKTRPRFALSNANAIASASTAGEIEVLEQGDGVFSIRIAAGQNILDTALIEGLLRAFAAIRNAESLRVVLLGGSDDSFLRGGNDGYNQALALGLHQAIATFPYPVVAVMQGSATGAGWWLASLCDLLLCSEGAQYGYAPADRAMLAAQADFLRERFGSVQAQQLHSPAGYWSGAQLKASGWSCAILPREQIHNRAQTLASQLAAKSALALRLLKAHLARPLSERVAALAPAASGQAGRWTGSEAARVIRLDQRDLATVAQQFAEAVAQIEAGAAYRSIVLASEVAPFDGSEAPEQALALLIAIESANVPVIAALGGDAQNSAWLLALACDACVLAESGWYGGADFAGSTALSARAAWLLPEVLGRVVGEEMLLTGEQYSGAQLRQRVAALDVRPAGQVMARALQLALSWSAPAPDSVIAAKRARVAVAAQQLQARPSWLAASSESAVPSAGRIALATTVVSATAQANGVLLIEMHDRDAKNMFSDALVAGINEAFAHAASLPYRAVVLGGYDNYFASGGTKESLLAIQAGTAKFTDFKIFQLAQLCEVPVIAAMQGHGVGAGWSLGMFADIVLFGEGSHYVSPYMSYGFTPGAGSTLMVPHKLGHDLGRESLLTAHEYVGRELRERGMAQAVLPREQVLAEALALAQRIARTPRSHLVNFKQQWTAQLRARIEDTYQRELAMHDETFVGKAETSGHIHARFEQLERASAPVAAAAVPVAAATPAPRRAVAATATAGAATHTLASIRAKLKESLDAELHMQGRPIDDEEQFIHLGIDSINGVTWMRRINTDFGTGFEATTIYSYPTIRELAAFLHAQLKPAAVMVEALPELLPEPLPVETPLAAAPPRKPVVRRSMRNQGRLRSTAARDEADTRIAIVGMSGRYPQAENLDQFWDNLVRGRNSIVEVPAARWNADAYYDRDAKKKDKMASRWLGAMDDIDCFDPLFFRISPEEAQYMDPQHRLFLQESYRAFEDAGYSSQTLSNHRCGVYLGISMNEYAMLLSQHGVMAAPVTGNSYSIAAARIAYYLNLKGPAISVDTACSSSLVALHLACQALRSGEVNMALAGGVSLWLLPESYLSMSQAGMLSPSGQCKAFDDSADGIVMGDGVGALVLKRLADAEADNDVIHGVIIGSGTNQDGRTNGITAPSVVSQIELERSVYQRYGIDPATISYVEAHGTGTRLGDPIELQALSTVFKERTDKKHYCALASVKSNIGHASSAAGVASVQKVLLSLRHRTLAPTLHVSRENSHFDFANSPFYVNRSAKSWDSSAGAPRRACVNSFGYSGTNAHVVIEEYVASATTARPAAAQAIPLSARTPEQLRQKVQELLGALQRPAPAELAAVAYTLQVGREAMEMRLGFVAASMPQLVDQLRLWLSGEHRIDAMFAGEALAADDSEATQHTVELALQRGDPAALLQAWVNGAGIDWERLHAGSRPARASLPSYPFAKERYWVEGNKSTDASAAGAQQPGELAWIENILAQVDSDTLEQDKAVAMLRQWV
ncbi:acyl transferase domain-containing protein [Tahibacter aquaticus]|uniref:Acyl transferase domain-containing protein n=1 Tax=Tahibacter aquaticus TaxID=520092 RepID=A0A4R6YHP1_9GAMM|nr:SDR family NAD(P)-dependent oxidoreductase [Tahibacter aquaticus]TDR36317.1 acyl transferase domain-containing protein [Tahibacter aquaticus]